MVIGDKEGHAAEATETRRLSRIKPSCATAKKRLAGDTIGEYLSPGSAVCYNTPGRRPGCISRMAFSSCVAPPVPLGMVARPPKVTRSGVSFVYKQRGRAFVERGVGSGDHLSRSLVRHCENMTRNMRISSHGELAMAFSVTSMSLLAPGPEPVISPFFLVYRKTFFLAL